MKILLFRTSGASVSSGSVYLHSSRLFLHHVVVLYIITLAFIFVNAFYKSHNLYLFHSYSTLVFTIWCCDSFNSVEYSCELEMVAKDPCSLVFISGGCNSNSFAAGWGQNNKICVAIEEAVAILQPELVCLTINSLCIVFPMYIVFVFFRVRKLPVNSQAHYLLTLNELMPSNGFKICLERSKILLYLPQSILQRLCGSGNKKITIPNMYWRVIFHVLYRISTYKCRIIQHCCIAGHKDAVTDVQGVSLKLTDDLNCILIATMSIDTLIVWKKTDHEGTLTVHQCIISSRWILLIYSHFSYYCRWIFIAGILRFST